MHCVRKVTENLYWVGANDRRITLFENIHPVPEGVSYNSYLLLGDKTVLFDCVDWSACRGFIENIKYLLNGRTLDYIIVNHVEPDHGASLDELLLRYPNVKIVATDKAFAFMRQFGFSIDSHELISAKPGVKLEDSGHTISFIPAPMVHWPEVMFTFDETNGALFTADAFGTFKTLDGRLFNDEMDFDREFLDEARRYYSNIVGKYGAQVQAVLKKLKPQMEKVKFICPLHGPIWRNNFEYILGKYDLWSSWQSEEKGVLIVYASMYGNTESAANTLAALLCDRGVSNVKVCDVSKTHASYIISEGFKYSHIIFASCTYNFEIYPPMQNLLTEMKGVALQNRTCAVLESGTWAIKSGDLIEQFLKEQLKNMNVLDKRVTVLSSLTEEKLANLEELADSVAESFKN